MFWKCIAWMLISFLKLIPYKLFTLFGKFFGLYVLRPIKYRHEIICENIEHAYPDPESRPSIDSLYRHFGLLAGEILYCLSASQKSLKKIVQVRNNEFLDEALKKEKGVVLLAGHLGCWELALISLAAHGYPVTIVSKQWNHPLGTILRHRLRGRFNIESLDNQASGRGIVKSLKKNRIVILVVDQYTKRPDGIYVDFFGRPASTTRSAAWLVQKFGAPVVPGYVYRTEDASQHFMCADKEIDYKWVEGDVQLKIWQMTQLYTEWLEMRIREHPDQWTWMHKRWKKQEFLPDNYDELRKKYLELKPSYLP